MIVSPSQIISKQKRPQTPYGKREHGSSLERAFQSRLVKLLAIATFILWNIGSEIGYARSIAFPSTWLRYEDDTYAAVVEQLQQNDRESLLNCINRGPLVSRQVLIRLLREQDKLARSFAELFRIAADSELEIPLVHFSATADAPTRERLLQWVETVTDAEWFLETNDYPDRFSSETEKQAGQDLKAAIREFHEMGFVDGEAFCLNTWFKSPSAGHGVGLPASEARLIEAEQIDGVEKAMLLFQQTGNLRGESHCLVTLAGLSFVKNDPKKITELLNHALEKAVADHNLILQSFLWNWRKLYQVEEAGAPRSHIKTSLGGKEGTRFEELPL